MWLKKVGFGCTVFSDHHFQILCAFSFPRQPWGKLVYKLWGFAAVPQFSGSVLLLLLSYWGRTLVHWHCKQKAAALCLYEFQAHIKYEGSLSTLINFGDNSSSPHTANKGRESGKKRALWWILGLDSVLSTLNYSCLLATKLVKTEQGKLLYYSSSHWM